MNFSSSFIHLSGLLRPDELVQLASLPGKLSYTDGKNTASGAAQKVKNNLQASAGDSDDLQTAQRIIIDALAASPLFHAAAIPKMILPPIFSKYEPGMEYGMHVDSPLMTNIATIRADLSMTIFLTEPGEYAGGELVINTSNGFTPFKLKKGDAIVYPTTKLHCVNPVTSGERNAAVTWVQSMVRSAEQRELLFQLNTAKEIAAAQGPTDNIQHLLLQQLYSNLLRMWADV